MAKHDDGLPSISVYIPNYNHGYLIHNALESICTQDYQPHEVVVFDDCSTDNSVQVIESFAQRYPFVRCVRYPEKSKNFIKALYANIPILTGEYVLGVAADDTIYPGLLRRAAQMIGQHPGVGAVFSDINVLFPDYSVVKCCRSGYAVPTYANGAEITRQICKPTVLESCLGSVIRKDAFLELVSDQLIAIGFFCDVLVGSVVALRYGAGYLPEPGVGYRYSPNQFGTVSVLDPTCRRQCYEDTWKYLNSDLIRPTIPEVVIPAILAKLEALTPAAGTTRLSRIWIRGTLPLVLSRFSMLRSIGRALFRFFDKWDGVLFYHVSRWRKHRRKKAENTENVDNEKNCSKQ
jgi:glycosyltransferase involved in cell wall biosynthesis